MPATLSELVAKIADLDIHGPTALGTAQWMAPRDAVDQLKYAPHIPSERIWLGTAFKDSSTEFGFADNRHVTLVSGTRGGKGAGIIIPNLCLWPGSCIVVDPKGENAIVTARRRANGSVFARGLGQHVCVLDPFHEIDGLDDLQACFNPLDVIAKGDLAVDDAGRMAAALVMKENTNDPFWEEAARSLVKCLILHVLSWPAFEGRRNLLTVRTLLTQGDIFSLELAMAQGLTRNQMPSAEKMLHKTLLDNKEFNGIVSGAGARLAAMPDKMRLGVIEIACMNTVFMDGPPMQRMLAKSDFSLDELKRNPKGFTLYMTLPTRYMDEHFRWLRLMVTLAIGEMERVKGKPATGHRTLFLLDEFAGLKRMEVVENAVAQAAGFGLKFFFVMQNFPQLKNIYGDAWENFISNSGLKIFFHIEDPFTRDYLSRLLGEREVRRASQSKTKTTGRTETETHGKNKTTTQGTSTSRTKGTSVSFANVVGSLFPNRQSGTNNSTSTSQNEGLSSGTNYSFAIGDSSTDATGMTEGIHKRPLMTPDEMGHCLGHIEDKTDSKYPGGLVAIVPSRRPLLARRANYYESPVFAGLYDRHPEYDPPPTLAERASSQRALAAQIDWTRSIRTPARIIRWAWKSSLITRGAQAAAVILAIYIICILTSFVWSKTSAILSGLSFAKVAATLPGTSGTGIIAALPISTTTPALNKVFGTNISLPQPSARQADVMSSPNDQMTTDPVRLETAARKATDYFYWSHGSDSGSDTTALQGIYAPVVNFYGRRRRSTDFINDKLKIAQKWPTRHFSYTERPLVGCNTDNQTCTVTGHVQFKFENDQQQTATGLSSFSLTFADLGRHARVVAESGKVEQRY